MICPICNHLTPRLAFQKDRLGKQWDIYDCGYCRTEFVYPVPSSEELNNLYAEHYSESSEEHARLMNPNYGRLSFPRQWGIIKKLVGQDKGAILDYGCGGGHFLSRVSDGWLKYGVEISENARVVAQKKGICVVADIDSLVELHDYFDVIVMFATIEHLPNPKEVVKRLSGLLKIGGLFVVMTGDARSVKALVQNRNWHLYTPPGHLHFFSAYTVDYLMESLSYGKIKHLYTDGGVTQIPFKPLNLALRVGIEAYHRIPVVNTLPLFDTYYGYYRKELV